jgi:hypothetical protein
MNTCNWWCKKIALLVKKKVLMKAELEMFLTSWDEKLLIRTEDTYYENLNLISEEAKNCPKWIK